LSLAVAPTANATFERSKHLRIDDLRLVGAALIVARCPSPDGLREHFHPLAPIDVDLGTIPRDRIGVGDQVIAAAFGLLAERDLDLT
jgi:hypothetical protein